MERSNGLCQRNHHLSLQHLSLRIGLVELNHAVPLLKRFFMSLFHLVKRLLWCPPRHSSPSQLSGAAILCITLIICYTPLTLPVLLGEEPSASVGGSASGSQSKDVASGEVAANQGKGLTRELCAQYLSEGTFEQKIEAITSLVQLRESGIDLILQALQDHDPRVRAKAITALAELAPLDAERVIPQLLVSLEQDDGFVDGQPNWIRASQAIGKYGDKVLPILEKLWQDTDLKKRMIFCIVCYELGPIAAPMVPKLITLAEDNQDPCRRAAIGAMVVIGPGAAPAVPILRKQLYHEDFHTQYWSCRALAAIGSPALPAVPDLVDRLKNGVASVRRNAAAALGKLGPDIGPEAIAALIQAVDDPIQPVREQAVLALGRIGPQVAQQAREAIEKSHENRPIFPKSAATWAIWRLGGPLEPLAESLVAEIKEGIYREEATAILREMGTAGEPIQKRLKECLSEASETDSEEVANIQATLQELGAAQASQPN